MALTGNLDIPVEVEVLRGGKIKDGPTRAFDVRVTQRTRGDRERRV